MLNSHADNRPLHRSLDRCHNRGEGILSILLCALQELP